VYHTWLRLITRVTSALQVKPDVRRRSTILSLSHQKTAVIIVGNTSQYLTLTNVAVSSEPVPKAAPASSVSHPSLNAARATGATLLLASTSAYY